MGIKSYSWGAWRLGARNGVRELGREVASLLQCLAYLLEPLLHFKQLITLTAMGMGMGRSKEPTDSCRLGSGILEAGVKQRLFCCLFSLKTTTTNKQKYKTKPLKILVVVKAHNIKITT